MPGHAASGVCEFASSRGFGLHSCPFSSLRLISPSHPTAGLQTGFLRMGLLWVSAPGTGPGISAIFWREVAAAGAGTRERRLLVLGPQPEVAGPPVQEQFQDPPLVGACTLPAAELPGQRCTDVRQLPCPCSEAQRAASKSCPFWTDVPHDSSPFVWLRLGKTNGFVSDRRLPFLPLMEADAFLLWHHQYLRVPMPSYPKNILPARKAPSSPV